MKKWIEHNKKEYGVQIIELKKIIEGQVLASGVADEFTSDMYVALISGRKITEKMSAAIDKLIKLNSPDEMLKREEWVDKVLPKLMMVENLINDTSWSDSYKASSIYFLKSIIKQAKNRKTLSQKQMEAVSSIYARVKKNIKKSEKKA
tara:strand:- start:243 stop:686 length:444 start_codon:yes stop_codon:yes gene_type:complete